MKLFYEGPVEYWPVYRGIEIEQGGKQLMRLCDSEVEAQHYVKILDGLYNQPEGEWTGQ